MFLIIQVQVAYRSKVEELTKQELDEEELNKKVELLKVSNWTLPFYKRNSNVLHIYLKDNFFFPSI